MDNDIEYQKVLDEYKKYGFVPSPCISVCSLDENKICKGCFRTAEEIRNWTKWNNEKRLEVWKDIISRYK